MKSWKPLIVRIIIFFLLLYAVVPAAIKWIGIQPQVSINVLYVPIVFAGMLLAFVLLKREELKKFKYTSSWKQSILFGLLAYSLFALYIIQQNLKVGYEYYIAYLVIGWALYLVGGFLLFLAVFNYKFVKTFLKPLLISILIAILYGGGALFLNLLGRPITKMLAIPLAYLLALTNSVNLTMGARDPALSADGFRAVIGTPCTGITSLVLFTGLFLFVVLLDWKKINKKSLLWIYPVGVVGMFIVAFLRLYLLYLIGANWSRDFAMAGFHNNAGWILFVAYFLVYFYFTYSVMQKKSKNNRNI